jgi:hypothetical protein
MFNVWTFQSHPTLRSVLKYLLFPLTPNRLQIATALGNEFADNNNIRSKHTRQRTYKSIIETPLPPAGFLLFISGPGEFHD